MGIDRLVRETAVPAPDFSAETASTVLREHFGVEAGCTLLAGERDQNFHAVGADGNQFLLKIWNHSQRPQAVDFLVRLLRFLHRHHPEIPVARVRHSLDEKPWSTVRA
jgi:hydroxylysine kinase